MKCPICGHHLARLADPCLHCAAVLSGRAVLSVSAASEASAPTSLTLPAELRVPETPVSAAPAPTPSHTSAEGATASSRAVPLEVPSTAHSSRVEPASVSAGSGTVEGRAKAPNASTAPEPSRNPTTSPVRVGVVVGVVLLGWLAYLGVQRHRAAAPAAVEVPLGMFSAVPALPAVIDRSDVAASTPAGRERPVASARRAIASPAATARPKAKPLVASHAAPALPTVPLQPAAEVTLAPPPSTRPAAEPVLQRVPDPAVTDPREACGKRGFFARALCINERCAQASFAGHAECVKLRKAAEDAEQAALRGG